MSSDRVTSSVVQIRVEGGHLRHVNYRPVTFTCKTCCYEVTQMRLPAPTPKYCSPECKKDAIRERVRLLKLSKPDLEV